MKRRHFFKVIGGSFVVWALPAQAKLPSVGFMGNSTAVLEANLVGAFRHGLRELGYEQGRNIVIEYRWAEGDYERFPALVAELIAAQVDVIVTAGTPAALAVKKATSTVPLVMVAVGDPVGTGLVSNLARPGGNLTGLSSVAPDLEGKRLDILRQIVPTLSRVAVFFRKCAVRGSGYGIKLQLHDIRDRHEPARRHHGRKQYQVTVVDPG
jgi:putative tryptophan/tyrosine transport system substrate-binding protein